MLKTILSKLKSLKNISIWKTLHFNFHYFDLKGLRNLPVLIAEGVILKKLHGELKLNNWSFGAIRIGFPTVGMYDYRRCKSILEIDGKIEFLGKAIIGQGSKICVMNEGKLVWEIILESMLKQP